MQRRVTGPFEIVDCGGGGWCLRNPRPPGAAVFVSGAAPPAGSDRCTAVTIDWRDAHGVALRLDFPLGSIDLEPGSVLVHEPRQGLYDALPLAKFDAETQRFWRRVFAIVRLPGGRFFLGLLARLARRRG